ncbi:MAG: hypothetical protein M3Z09_03605 [Acidobacteriota bacterium]|nr:hypothetical protein [Acidobacteriota bacterium]
MQNFREFDAGPDPFGVTWHVRFKWLQTAISIRHSNSVDAKFILDSGTAIQEKTISLPYPELLEVSNQSGTPMTDAWCTRLAMLHLEYLVASGEDMEKDLVTVSAKEMMAYSARIRNWEVEEVRRIRGAA